jgi:peroxiredoxin
LSLPGATIKALIKGWNMPKVALNTPAPDFELPDYSGKLVRLSDFRGKNVLLVFNRGFI